MTTTNHSFTSSGLTSIMALGFSSSTPLNRRRSVPPHLRHRVGGTSTYGYSVGRVPGIVRDDEGEQESDDKDLGE